MAYRVDVARSAEGELEALYLWVIERAPQQGAAWFNGLERAVLSLDRHPERCPVASESIDPVKIVGLTIDAERLADIRSARVRSMGAPRRFQLGVRYTY